MGVYMPTVEMPTNCTECKLRLVVGCNPYKDNGLSPSKERHKDCPLVEIKTPHGRLVDIRDINELMNRYKYDDFDHIDYHTPTVIKAEESE